MKPALQHVSIDGDTINKIIFDRLAPALAGEQLSHSVLGMLTYAIILMKPDISNDQLQNLVMDASSYIVMQLTPIDAGEAN